MTQRMDLSATRPVSRSTRGRPVSAPKRAVYLAALAALAGAAPLQAQESYRLGGERVAVYNLAGDVQIVPGRGSDVEVLVRTGGDDARQLTVETGRVNGRMTLRVMYPGDRVVYPMTGRNRYETTMRVRDDGTWSGGNSRGDRVRITGSGSGLEAHADLEIRVPAGTSLEVFHGVGEIAAQGVQGDLLIDGHAGPVSVEDIRGALNVDTGSGRISATGIQGEVSVDTGSGGVTLEDVRGRMVYVDTGSGSVEGRGIVTDRIEIDTGSGSVSMDEVRAPEVMVDTGSGSVTLGLMGDLEDVEVDTGSGSVTLVVPSSLDAEIMVETGSGGIDVDLPMERERRRRDSFRGVMGDGSGRIVVDTGSGRIQLRSGEMRMR